MEGSSRTMLATARPSCLHISYNMRLLDLNVDMPCTECGLRVTRPVRLCAWHDRELCKNGQTDDNNVWIAASCTVYTPFHHPVKALIRLSFEAITRVIVTRKNGTHHVVCLTTSIALYTFSPNIIVFSYFLSLFYVYIDV